jgi:DNA-binding beta-propeller fold protein YncE
MLSGAGQEAALWAEQTRLPGMQLTFERTGQGAGEVLGVMASADGKLAYVLDAVNGLLFFDTGTGQCMAQISDRPGAYQGFLPGPDEGHVVLAGAACALIDVRVPSLVARLNGPLGRALAIGFPAAGEALMIGPAGNVRAAHYELPRQVGLEGPGEAVRVAATGKIAVQYRPWNRGGYLVVYDLERAQALRQIAVPAGGERLELTANGRWAVMQAASGVVVANLETGQVQQVAGVQRAGALGLSEDGRTMAAADAGEGGVVTLWDVGRGAQKIALEPLHTQVAGLVFSPDGSMVVASTRMGGRSAREVTTPQGAWGFEVASGKRVRSVPMTGRAPVATTFTADGSTLMVVDSQQGVQCLEGKTLGLRWLSSMGEGRISRVAVSADGERILVLSGGVHLWDAGTKQQVALGPMPLEERAFPYFDAGRAMVFSLSADDNLRSNVGSVQALHPMKDGE